MQRQARLATTISVAAFLLLRSTIADAYIISIVGTPQINGSEDFSVAITQNRISVSDFFDRYDESRWEIASVQQDVNGGVNVTYNFPTSGTWDSYGAFANVAFRLLAESGDLTPQAVAIDVWGSSYYQHRLYNTCCFSDPPQVDVFGTGSTIPQYHANYNETYDAFATTYFLLSNTTYTLTYLNVQYVEGSPSYFPRTHFNSMDAYNSFVQTNGTSGTIFASAFGFINYNLAIRPTSVPEPATWALFGLGLVGIGLAGRKRKAKM